MDPELCGVWNMISSTTVGEDGKIFELYGNGAGFVHYQASGRMVGMTNDLSRPGFATPDGLAGTDDETKAAYEGFASYEGTWDTDHNVLLHDVVTSSIPDIEGIRQERPFERGPDTITLLPPGPRIGGQSVRPRLIYKKDVRPPVELSPGAAQLLGVWRVVSVRAVGGSSGERDLYGSDPHGFLSYDQYGRMTSILASSTRLNFASRDFRDGTPTEIRAAFTGFNGIAGTYTVDEPTRTITHLIKLAILPNWWDTERIRTYELDGDTLTTAEETLLGGELVTVRAVWKLEAHNAAD